MSEHVVVIGHITSVNTFADGNNSYTVREDGSNSLFRFTEPTALTDGKKPLLRGSTGQFELEPVLDKDGNVVVAEFARRDGTQDAVAVTRLSRWYLVEAAKAADEKRAAQPLVPATA